MATPPPLKAADVPISTSSRTSSRWCRIIGAFRRMVRDVEFDVCEMAPTTYMIARALGAPFMALPVFFMRRFHHGGFVVRPDAGIQRAEGSRRQEGRRARLFGHHRRLDARHLRERVRSRLRQGDLGGRRRGARHDAEASAQCRARARRQVARRHDGERRAAGRLHRPRRHRPRRSADRRLGAGRADAAPSLSRADRQRRARSRPTGSGAPASIRSTG